MESGTKFGDFMIFVWEWRLIILLRIYTTLSIAHQVVAIFTHCNTAAFDRFNTRDLQTPKMHEQQVNTTSSIPTSEVDV
jgi:hypothetical protein